MALISNNCSINTKKKLLSVVGAIALAAVASWNVYQSRQEATLSDLMLENIESLARGEIETLYDFHLERYTSGCVVCERGGTSCDVHAQEPC